MGRDDGGQVTQICVGGMNGSLEHPQRGVPNAATLGDMESPVNKKQARLFLIHWALHIASSDLTVCVSLCGSVAKNIPRNRCVRQSGTRVQYH
jgi:hypothetical protein